MMTAPFSRAGLRRASVFAAVAAAVFAAPVSAAPPSPPSAGDSLVDAPTLEAVAVDGLRPLERTFLLRASELSRQQLQIAQLAVSQAASADIRTHAQQVAADNRQLGESLDSLARKKGTASAGIPVTILPQAYQQLAQISGSDFDREFVRIAAELQATMMTLLEETTESARDADIRELAASYLPVLRSHQNTSTALKKTFD